MSLREKISEKALELIEKRIFNDLVELAVEDIEKASRIYASWKMHGLNVKKLDVDTLDEQGWDVNEISFNVKKEVEETIYEDPYIVYKIYARAPNGADGYIVVNTIPLRESRMNKETWKKYMGLREEFKQKAAPKLVELLQNKLKELQKKLEECSKKLEECKEKLEETVEEEVEA